MFRRLRTIRARHWIHLVSLAGVAFAATGCHIDMWYQSKKVAQDENEFFRDGKADRLPVAGTVARGELRHGDAFFTGRVDGKLITDLPARVEVSKELLERGKERYTIFCSHCHGAAGDGKGMIAQRGLSLRRPPASFHTDRLREMPLGHFYEVISNGFGVMYQQGTRIDSGVGAEKGKMDRWAIVAYIRALQLSQYYDASGLSAEEQEKLGIPAPEQIEWKNAFTEAQKKAAGSKPEEGGH